MGVYYCYFIPGDARGYWEIAKNYSFDTFKVALFNGEGTRFMVALNYPFSGFLNMSYLSNTLVFSLLGFMGLTFFYMVAVKTIPYNKILYGYILFPALFFLPNLHFWSAGVGKDTILLLCIGMFCYGVLKPVSRSPLLVFSMLLAFALRPHMVLFLVLGFGFAYILGGKISVAKRVFFSTVLLGIGLAILPSVLQFVKIDDASIESFDKFASAKANVLSRASTGSSIDISSYPLPLKVLTFWFRPFFFDVRNINGLIVSIENLILVIVFVKAMRSKPLQAFKAAPFVIKGLVLFLIIGTLAFSQSLGNIGIMIRMRNMFLPGFLIYVLWIFSYQKQRLLQERTRSKSLLKSRMDK